MLSKLPNYEKWFRFPYLKEGDTKEKRDAMRAALKKAGYRNAYITANIYDWHIEDQFQAEVRKKTKLDFKKLGAYYADIVLKAAEHYEKLALKHLGRSPKHIAVMHETDMNALFITDIVAKLEANGWKIISPREAYKDEIANYTTASLFQSNPGRIGEIARDKGQKDGLWCEVCHKDVLDRMFAQQVLQ